LLHQIDPALQLIQFLIILALLNQLVFFLNLVFPFTSIADEIGEDDKGDGLELGEEIAKGLSSGSPR
jgi:hypothetical protein